MLREEFDAKFQSALFNRGCQRDAPLLADYAWNNLGHGKADIWVSIALGWLEKNYSRSDKKGSIDEAEKHANQFQRGSTTPSSGPKVCELCGGGRWFPVPVIRRPGTYTHPGTPSYTQETTAIIYAARQCVCAGGFPIGQDILSSYEERKAWDPSLGRYERFWEWVHGDCHWFIKTFLAPRIENPIGVRVIGLPMYDPRFPRTPGGLLLTDLLALEPASRKIGPAIALDSDEGPKEEDLPF